jgi:hypothetical protein
MITNRIPIAAKIIAIPSRTIHKAVITIKLPYRIEPIVGTIRRTDKTPAIGRLARTTKEIIGLLHYLLFDLPNHFGNSPR